MSSENSTLNNKMKRSILREDIDEIYKLGIKNSKKAVLFAAKKNKTVALRYLVGNGADVNISDALGYTPLHYVIQNENVKMIPFLVRFGACVDATSKAGVTPLHLAAKCRNHKVHKRLLEFAPEVLMMDDNQDTPIHVSAFRNCPDTIQAILNVAEDVLDYQNHAHETPLAIACRNNNFESVKVIVEEGASQMSIDIKQRDAVHIAATLRDTKIIEYLIKFDHTVVHSKCIKKSATPLHYACKAGNSATITLLLAAGAKIDKKDKHGRTPLCYATKKHQVLAVDTLLKNGANVLFCDNDGKTTIDYINYSVEILRVFLNHGLPIDTQNSNLDTLLHLACKNTGKSHKFFFTVLNEKPNTEIKNDDGETPLFIAISSKCPPCVLKPLVELCQSFDIKNKRDMSALTVAIINKNKSAIDLLIRNGASLDLATKTTTIVLNNDLNKSIGEYFEIINDYTVNFFIE